MNLSNYSSIEELFQKCFTEITPYIKSKKIASNQPRDSASSFRDPITQAGIVCLEGGSVEIRSGKSGTSQGEGAGCSIVLHPSGKIIIVAPKGITGMTSIDPSLLIPTTGNTSGT